MNRIISGVLALGTALSLVGCGGGGGLSDPEQVTKVLFDGPVVGVDYSCSSFEEGEKQQTTDKGEFTCLEGDTAIFYIGSYELGRATVEDDGKMLLTVDDIAKTEAAATDIKQLLQTLDEKSDDDVITVPKSAAEQLSDVAVKPGESAFDTEMSDVIGEELVPEEEAVAQAKNDLDTAKTKELFSGKTLYMVSNDGMQKMVFNNEVTEVTMTNYSADGIAENTSDVDPVSIEGEKLIINESGDYVKLNSDKGDYQLWDMFDANRDFEKQIRVYSDQAKAKAYLLTFGGDDTVVESDGCHVNGDALTVDEGKSCEFQGHTAVCNSGSITVDSFITSGNIVTINELSFTCSN